MGRGQAQGGARNSGPFGAIVAGKGLMAFSYFLER